MRLEVSNAKWDAQRAASSARIASALRPGVAGSLGRGSLSSPHPGARLFSTPAAASHSVGDREALDAATVAALTALGDSALQSENEALRRSASSRARAGRGTGCAGAGACGAGGRQG